MEWLALSNRGDWPSGKGTADLLQSLMTTWSGDVAERFHVPLEAKNVAEKSDVDASSRSGENFTDVGVQADGPRECHSLAATEFLDHELSVGMTN